MSLIVSKFIKPTTPDTVQAIVEMDKKKKANNFQCLFLSWSQMPRIRYLRTSCFIMFSNIRLVYTMFQNSEDTQFISEDSNATGIWQAWQAGRGFPSHGVIFLNSLSPNSCSIPSTFNDLANCYCFCVAMCSYRTIPEVHTHCKLNDLFFIIMDFVHETPSFPFIIVHLGCAVLLIYKW